MLAQTDFTQIRDYVVKILPQLIRETPEIVTTIEGIMAQHFPRRDEFARLLDEVKLLRQEMIWRFELQSKEFQEHRQETEQRLELLRKEMEQRINLLREDMERRFEQVDKRFEQVDQQLTGLRQDTLQMKRDIIKLQAGQDSLAKQVAGQQAWLQMTIGNLHNEKGRTLEDMFAAGLRHGLQDDEIQPDTIRLRQPLVDTEGLVFKKGYITEVDLVAQNGKLTVFEVKATAKAGEVDLFAWKVALVKAQNPTLQVRGVFICLGAPAEVKQRCLENELELLG